MREGTQTVRITVTVAARRAGVEPDVVRHCVQLGLVSEGLAESDLADLRRVRRLLDLGVNLAGVEVILRMRRRLEALQAEMARLEASASGSSDRV